MLPGHMAGDGILSGPIDLDGGRRKPPVYRSVEARPGLVVRHRATGVDGAVVKFEHGGVAVIDRHSGARRLLRLDPGGFIIDGERVTLVPPTIVPVRSSRQRTASGSTALPRQKARVARASRILVEGIHDAELVEKVWGDDLRIEGVVVERLDGMDDLAKVVADFGPAPERRLGVLLDHLVDGSKETRAADDVHSDFVLVRGTPFVDVWQAVRPKVAGIEAWPTVPRGEEWKEGVLRRLGIDRTPGAYWRTLLGRVSSYADLEPALVGSVEELIDFVT